MKNFVIAEGIDGSGKSIIMQSLRAWAQAKGMKIIDIREYCEKHGDFPETAHLLEFDCAITSEPTHAQIGTTIRKIMVKQGHYSGKSLAMAFALDREILYKKVIIPMLNQNKAIFQERGLPTALVYQPMQDKLRVEELMKYPGNRLALEYAPGLLLIGKVSAETAVARMEQRGNKSVFDNLLFQRKLVERYNSFWLKSLFERHGTMVEYISSESGEATDAGTAAVSKWQHYLKNPPKEGEEQKTL